MGVRTVCTVTIVDVDVDVDGEVDVDVCCWMLFRLVLHYCQLFSLSINLSFFLVILVHLFIYLVRLRLVLFLPSHYIHTPPESEWID